MCFSFKGEFEGGFDTMVMVLELGGRE